MSRPIGRQEGLRAGHQKFRLRVLRWRCPGRMAHRSVRVVSSKVIYLSASSSLARAAIADGVTGEGAEPATGGRGSHACWDAVRSTRMQSIGAAGLLDPNNKVHVLLDDIFT